MVTGSADKNIRIWGLDYGDCHRSIFAHDDSIMAVQVREREGGTEGGGGGGEGEEQRDGLICHFF